jgi:hypothetical protein
MLCNDEEFLTHLESETKKDEDSITELRDSILNQLQAVINEVEAQRGKKISEELAEMLIQYAQNVIRQIEVWEKC